MAYTGKIPIFNNENALNKVKQDIFKVLETCPREVTGLLKKVEAGEVNGSCYVGECCCLLGTLAVLKIGGPLDPMNWRNAVCGATRETWPWSEAEMWFCHIAPGDTPETEYHSYMAAKWIEEWLESKGMIK